MQALFGKLAIQQGAKPCPALMDLPVWDKAHKCLSVRSRQAPNMRLMPASPAVCPDSPYALHSSHIKSLNCVKCAVLFHTPCLCPSSFGNASLPLAISPLQSHLCSHFLWGSLEVPVSSADLQNDLGSNVSVTHVLAL